jgi:hypothetical protein
MSTARFDFLRQEIDKCSRVEFLLPSDLLSLPTEVADVLQRTFRVNGADLAGLADTLRLEPAEAETIVGLLVDKRLLYPEEVDGKTIYKVRFSGRTTRPRRSPLDVL